MHICRNHTANQTTIAEYGGLAQLGTLMRHNGKEGPGVVEAEAAGALWSLAEGNDANKVSIAGSGAIATLCSLIGSNNERAQKHAASALSSLCSGSVANQEETTKLLVSSLHGGTLAAKERVLKSLWRLVRDNPEQKVSEEESGCTSDPDCALAAAVGCPRTLPLLLAPSFWLPSLAAFTGRHNHAGWLLLTRSPTPCITS